MLSIEIFCYNDFAENTFVVHDSQECIIVDPGCIKKQEVNELIRFIENNHLKPISIINTHCHIDHVLGVEKIKNYFNIPFYIAKEELPVLQSVKLYASVYGYPDFIEPVPDGFLKEGATIFLGNQIWQVIHVPGHSPGHIALFNKSGLKCISGDVLFNQSIGRTDLPGGNYETLIKSIRNKIFTLPEDTIIYPGHGPETSVNHEKRFNPFFSENV